jgi:hypothetical protein
MLAAFVNGEQRGFIKALEIPIPLGGGYGFLMLVYSNEAEGENISFQYYDFSDDVVYDISETLNFVSDMVEGSLVDPVVLNVSLGVDVNISLYAGWNWISTNTVLEDMSLNSFLGSIDNGNGFYIKSQDAYADYYAGFGWFGPLDTLDYRNMYKLKMINSDNLEFVGNPVSVEESIISLDAGWNWIGYTPQIPLDINQALSGITPDAGVYIKSQDEYPDYYTGFGWFGPLAVMEPYEGYALNMNTNDEFAYSLGLGRYDDFDADLISEFSSSDFEYNGSISIKIIIDGYIVNSDYYELIAFSNGFVAPTHSPLLNAINS